MPKEVSCSDFEELAVLYATGELSDEDRSAADAHAAGCATCLAVLQSEIALQESVAARVRASATDKLDGAEFLLAQCRSELAEALDDDGARAGTGAVSGWRAWLSPSRGRVWWAATFRRALAFHPGWSTAALLVVGTLGGTFGGTMVRGWYRATSLPLSARPVLTVSAAPRLSDQELETMGVEGIRWEPQDGGTRAHVEVRLRSERPVVVQGSADDGEIRRLLTYVLAHGQRFDPSMRLDSLDVLRTHISDPQVRAALCEAALRDEDPAVRLKALEALRGLGTDASVRQAMLGALAADGNSGVRIEAINAIDAAIDAAIDGTTNGLMASFDGSPDGSGDRSGYASAGDNQVGTRAGSPAGPRLGAGLSTGLLNAQALDILRDRERNDPNNYVRLRSAAVLGRLASVQTEPDQMGPTPTGPAQSGLRERLRP